MYRATIKQQTIDLSKSLLNEDLRKPLTGIVEATGSVVLDEQFRLFPIISDFLSYNLKNGTHSKPTVKTYSTNLINFITYIRSLSQYAHDKLDEAVLHVTKTDIQAYLNHLRDEVGLSGKTIRNRDATLMSFFNDFLCIERGTFEAYRIDNPYEDGLMSPAAHSKQIIAYNLEEVNRLIEASRYERERLIIQFMYDSGLRVSEVGRVSKQEIDEAYESTRKEVFVDGSIIRVPKEYAPVFVKGSKSRTREYKERYTLVSKSTLERIRKYHSSPLYKAKARKFTNEKPAFLNSNGDQWTEVSLGKMIERLAISSGIGKSAHKLRHGFAYSVLRSEDMGNSYLDRLVMLQKWLGHNHIKTTERYSQIPFEALDEYICLEDGTISTRSELMKSLADKTQLRIKLGDKK